MTPVGMTIHMHAAGARFETEHHHAHQQISTSSWPVSNDMIMPCSCMSNLSGQLIEDLVVQLAGLPDC